MRTFLTGLILISCFCQQSSSADNWPHWRGVSGNSVAANASPPTQWSATKNVKWKMQIPGRGSGSPVIWDDQVFVTTAVPADIKSAVEPASLQTQPPRRGQGRNRSRGGGRGSAPLQTMQFKLMSFHRATGELVWEKVASQAKPHEGTHSTNGFASASPCTDGQHVYAHFGSRGLYCYSMDGRLVWKRDDFGQMQCRAGFGEGSSPTIAGDKIIVPWDHEGQSSIFALDKLTGKTIWTENRDEPTCWATPLVINHDGKQQIVMNGQTCARSYDLETGKELWRCAGQTERPVASAVAAGGLVIVGSGHRGSFMAAFRPDGKGDIQGTDKVVWTVNRDTPDIGSPLLSDGRLYFHKGKTGLLSCLDAATGTPHYTASRIPGLSSIYASPVAAGGYVFLTGRSGTTTVIKDANVLEVVATNSVGETVDATPAPVGNQLFIRGEKHLFCIAE